MRRFVLPFVLLAVAAGNSSADRPAACADDSALAAPPMREWTDQSGQRQVRAALIRIEGGKLIFRRASGQLATTTLAALSAADRQFVAQSRQNVAVTALLPLRRPTSPTELSPAEAVRPERSLADDPGLVPARLVFVRVSRDFLREYVERDVRQSRAVSDCILGTPISGWASTHGVTRLLLVPDSRRAVADILFTGAVHARTVGHAGRARIHSVGQTPFSASKRVVADADGLASTGAVARAATRSATVDVEPLVPGLRGRIVEQVAWRRAADSRLAADAVATRRAEQRLADELDGRVEQSLARAWRAVRDQVPQLLVDREYLPPLADFRSTPDYVEIVLRRDGAVPDGPLLAPPPVAGQPDISVRAHRTLVRRAAGDQQLRSSVEPLLSELLAARRAGRGPLAARPAGEAPSYQAAWSPDNNWLVFDYRGSRAALSGQSVVSRNGARSDEPEPVAAPPRADDQPQ